MAVPKFHGQWIRRIVKAISRQLPGGASSLSIDLNNILHDIAEAIFGLGGDAARLEYIGKMTLVDLMAEYCAELKNRLDTIVKAIRPVDTFIIAVDGVAPSAKMAQQRQRRYISVKSNIIVKSNTFKTKGQKRVRKPKGEMVVKPIFDRNEITPGTAFMTKIDEYLRQWIANVRTNLAAKVIYSSHLEPGEGEHKIMKFFRTGQVADKGNHVIYGLDADLYMLGMKLPVENVYLWRESSPRGAEIVSLNEVKSHIRSQLDNSKTNVIDDFIVMMNFVGNDFLPHNPVFEDMASSIDLMFEVYRSIDKPLTIPDIDGLRSIDLESLSAFIVKLAEKEPLILAEQSSVLGQDKNPLFQTSIEESRGMSGLVGNVSITRTFDFSRYMDVWYSYALQPRTPDATPIDTTTARANMCIWYLIGLNWVYRYYQGGHQAINTFYYYAWTYSPTLYDLSRAATIAAPRGWTALREYVTDLERPRSATEKIGTTHMFTPGHQLLAVLPFQSLSIIPESLRSYMSSGSSIADLIPVDYPIDKILPRKEIAIIPFVDPERLLHLVHISTEDWKRWDPPGAWITEQPVKRNRIGQNGHKRSQNNDKSRAPVPHHNQASPSSSQGWRSSNLLA